MGTCLRAANSAAELSIPALQSEVRALCRGLGLARETADRWMLGFSDVALSVFPGAHPTGKVFLRPVRSSRTVGIEMSLADARGAEWTREQLGWWIDECELRREHAGRLRLLVRKWAEAEPAP